jgi:hypothetical protein
MKNRKFFASVRRVLHLGALAACLFVTACTTGPAKGTVTIKTRIDFNVLPYTGTFEVSEGADILGCSAGSFVDTPMDDSVQKLLTCESGASSGTFTAEFNPEENPGPWSIVAATEDFTGLAGGGGFSIVVDNATASGVETLTGEIEYSP